MLQVLLDSFGWRNTFRILTATFAVVCILSLNFNPNVEETTVVEDLSSETKNVEQGKGIKSRISFYSSVSVDFSCSYFCSHDHFYDGCKFWII